MNTRTFQWCLIWHWSVQSCPVCHRHHLLHWLLCHDQSEHRRSVLRIHGHRRRPVRLLQCWSVTRFWPFVKKYSEFLRLSLVDSNANARRVASIDGLSRRCVTTWNNQLWEITRTRYNHDYKDLCNSVLGTINYSKSIPLIQATWEHGDRGRPSRAPAMFLLAVSVTNRRELAIALSIRPSDAPASE